MSHKPKRPVNLILAAQILTAGESIDEEKMLKAAMSTLPQESLHLLVAVDPRNLFTSLSTKRSSIGYSIRANVNAV